MTNKFEVSPSYGFWYRSRIKNNDFIDIGFNVLIPQQASSMNFIYNVSVFPFSNVSPRNNIEWNSGFGVAALFYDAINKRHDDIMSGEYNNGN